jgi:hypothetical protein
MRLEHLAGTDPRCNDRYHRCLGAAPSRPAAAMPPQGIRAYSFGAIGASEATRVRRDCAEAVIDEEWDLVAPEICRIRPPMEQEHRLTAVVVFQ